MPRPGGGPLAAGIGCVEKGLPLTPVLGSLADGRGTDPDALAGWFDVCWLCFEHMNRSCTPHLMLDRLDWALQRQVVDAVLAEVVAEEHGGGRNNVVADSTNMRVLARHLISAMQGRRLPAASYEPFEPPTPGPDPHRGPRRPWAGGFSSGELARVSNLLSFGYGRWRNEGR